jgi:TolB-like protein/tetratricopeptide (TPR) repeat protein
MGPDRSVVQFQLERILSAPEFWRSDRAARFLRLIVERTLDGRTDLLKESLLAIDAFGRPADFDPKADPVVRVEAIKLRRRLAEYYSREPNDPVRISIPKGRYVAEFNGRMDDAPLRRIIISPFDGHHSPPGSEWFAAGFTDELIAALARTPGLLVVCRQSGAASAEHDLRLTGSVRWDAQRVRISARVTDRDGSVLWSDNFDGTADASISIQESIAVTVASRLGLEVPRMATGSRSALPAARELYLRGRFEMHSTSPGALERAQACFERAIAIDTEYPLPYTQMVRLSLMAAIHGYGLPSERLTQAQHFVARALTLDPELPETHLARGTLLARFLYRWDDAEESFRCAIALDPSCAEAYWAMAHDCLLPLGRYAEAKASNQRAIELEPNSQLFCIGLPWVRLFAGEVPEARAAFERARAADPLFFFAQLGAAIAAISDDDPETAILILEPFASASPAADLWLAIAHLRAGQTGLAATLRCRWTAEQQAPTALALYEAAGGNSEAAILHLENAIQEHDAHVCYIAVHPIFKSLRGEPRFLQLLKRLSLPVPPIPGV